MPAGNEVIIVDPAALEWGLVTNFRVAIAPSAEATGREGERSQIG